MKKSARIYLVYGLLLPAAILAAAFFYAGHNGGVYKKGAFFMGTVVEVSVSGVKDPKTAGEAVDAAFAEIRRIEDKFSAFKKDSVVSRINTLKAFEMLDIDDETLYLIDSSIRYNRLTDGAFDITVKPLVDLWGFSGRRPSEPAAAEITDALRRVGSENIILDRVNKKIGFGKDGVKIDLGGIAKGYASDMALKVLKDRGIKNAIVNSGGDVYCLGRKSPHEPWKVGIRHPRVKNRLIGELRAEDRAVVTSGDYEKFFKAKDRIWCHIINPKTGIPVGSHPASVTIAAKTATEADALATAFMVLGYEKGARVIKENFDVDWMVVSEKEDGSLEIKTSEDFEGKYAYKTR
jgi:thiamine biosynthesis lipoprotein ApbE